MEKTCTVCGTSKALSEFGPDKRRADNKKHLCLDCEGKKAETVAARKAAKKPVEKQEIQVPKLAMVLDFTTRPELLENLKGAAQKQFRTPEMQVLYLLHEEYKPDAMTT